MYDFCEEYVLPYNGEKYFNLCMDEDGNYSYDMIDEDALLEDLPKDFLPEEPGGILLLIETICGISAIGRPSKFRKFGKYFDSYALVIYKAGVKQ